MDNSSSNIIDVFTKLIRSLECPVCYEYVSSPIWQCQSGHVLCNICKSSIHSCPTCREPYSPVRVRSLEYISELMLFPCKNDGCNEFLPLVKMTNHEMRCTRASANNFNDESSRVAFLQTTLLYHIEQHIAPFFINKSNTDRETQTVPDILPKVQKKDACTWTELKSNDGNPYPYSGDGEHLLASPAMFKDEPETSQNYTFKEVNKTCREFSTFGSNEVHCLNQSQYFCPVSSSPVLLESSTASHFYPQNVTLASFNSGPLHNTPVTLLPEQKVPKVRKKSIIRICDPNTGKDVTDEVLEVKPQTEESSCRTISSFAGLSPQPGPSFVASSPVISPLRSDLDLSSNDVISPHSHSSGEEWTSFGPLELSLEIPDCFDISDIQPDECCSSPPILCCSSASSDSLISIHSLF